MKIDIKFSKIQYKNVMDMICGSGTQKKQEQMLMSVYKIMVFMLMIVIAYIMAFALAECFETQIVNLFGNNSYINGCMLIALCIVLTFRYTVFRLIERHFIFPRIFPIQILQKIGYCFLSTDYLFLLKIQEEIMNGAKEVFVGKTNGLLSIFVNLGEFKKYRYIIPNDICIPDSFYNGNCLDFSWLDSRAEQFEKKYHAIGSIKKFILEKGTL